MRLRAAAHAGRSVKLEHSKKEEGILITVRGLGAIDDTNIDAYGDAFAACFGAPVTTLMRENAITESGTFAENTSSGGLKFHVNLKPQMLQVPDLFTFNITTTEGESQEVIINRYENVFMADEAYKCCCGRVILPGLREHATKCWTKKPRPKTPQTSAFPNNRNAKPAEEDELRP